MRFLLQTTEKYRIDTLEEKDEFEDEVRADGEEQGYIIKDFKYSEKNTKEKGEIIDTYYIVDVVKKFQEPKEPYKVINTILYKFKQFISGVGSFDD